MSMTEVSLATLIVTLFPMLYFLFSSLTFLLARLSDPIVTWLLRGLMNVYFRAVSITAAMAALAFAAAGRPGVATGMAALTAAAIGARWWFLRRMDAGLRARDAGDAAAVTQLRRLHVGVMAYNAIQVATVIGSIPAVFPMTA